MTDYQQQYPPPGYNQPPPPPKQRRGCLIPALVAGVVLAALFVLAAIASTSSEDDNGAETAPGATETPAAAPPGVEGEAGEIDDVTVDRCDAQPGLGWAIAGGTITNDSSGTSTYFLELNILDAAGTVVGNTFASVANVPAGGNATWEAPSAVELPEGGQCKLTSVERMAS